jgi:hypothetical protein
MVTYSDHARGAPGPAASGKEPTMGTGTAHTIACGHCGGQHATTAHVRRCSEGLLGVCLHYGPVDRDLATGALIYDECDRDAWETEQGWTCDAGHATWAEDWREAERPAEDEDYLERMDAAVLVA